MRATFPQSLKYSEDSDVQFHICESSSNCKDQDDCKRPDLNDVISCRLLCFVLVSLIPNMDKDVAIKAIEQFPAFAEFGKTVIEEYVKKYLRIIKKAIKMQRRHIRGSLISLSEQLEKEDSQNKYEGSFIGQYLLQNIISG